MSSGFPASQLDPEVLAADMGLDPAPFLAVISDVLGLYAEALERPDAAAR